MINSNKFNKNELENKRILITGGAGFIGSYIVKELLKEPVKEIIIYDNFLTGNIENIKNCLLDKRCKLNPYGNDIRETDILNKTMEGIDYVFHLAAMWLLHCDNFPRTAFEVNVYGTYNVLEACVKNKVKKIVFSSSASIYGSSEQELIREDHHFYNKSFYGATKIAGESFCTSFNQNYHLPVIILRYANVYGPGQKLNKFHNSLVPTIINNIKNKEKIIINGDGSQVYDFIYVEDIAKANILSIKSKIEYGIYNIGTGIPTSVKDIVNLILKYTKYQNEVIFKAYDNNDPRKFVKRRVLDINKAKKELNFEFKTCLEDGIKRILEYENLI